MTIVVLQQPSLAPSNAFAAQGSGAMTVLTRTPALGVGEVWVPPAPSTGVAWDPTVAQIVEADTIYGPLDPAFEETVPSGDGGWITAHAQGGATIWQVDSNVVTVPGPFTREALTANVVDWGYLWMPSVGLLPTDEFTIEMHLKCDVNWSAATVLETPFGFRTDVTEGIWITLEAGDLIVQYNHSQAGPASASVGYNGDAHLAGAWVSVALTLKAGTLSLIVNGAVVDTQAGIVPARVWDSNQRQEGFTICGGGFAARGATNWTVAELRVSRTARVVGQAPVLVAANTITVDPDTLTGKSINKNLVGMVQWPNTPLLYPGKTAAGNARLAAIGEKVVRIDKLLTCTPIKAGAVDGAHPSVGVSGAYSYDWQVVDRTLDAIVDAGRIGYVSIDSNVQILGGSVAPFSGGALTTNYAGQSGFAPGPVGNVPEYAKIVRDLVHHCVVEKGYTIPYWGVWNEIDVSPFWAGSNAQYHTLYEACVDAVKLVDPTLKVGGPEVSTIREIDRITGLIDYCATNTVPLDFISAHFYNGDLGEYARIKAIVDARVALGGLPAVEMVNGEWAWQVANTYGGGQAPFGADVLADDYHKNDFWAAYVAASLMEMQAADYALATFWSGAGITGPATEWGWDSIKLVDATADVNSWSGRNAFELFSRLEAAEVAVDVSADPGIFAVASKSLETGKLTVLIANLHYRNGLHDVTVALPTAGSVTVSVIDDGHANQRNAGLANAELVEVPAEVTDGAVSLVMKGRSVALLELDPSALLETLTFNYDVTGTGALGGQAPWSDDDIPAANALTTYIDPAQQLSFGRKSFWTQPWRAYQDTPASGVIQDALGINFNVSIAQAPHVARLLAAKGFTKGRVEIGWGHLDYADPTVLSTDRLAEATAKLEALVDYGLRPLILMNANHGGPCPMLQFTGTISAVTDSTHVTLAAGTTSQVVLGKTGFDEGGVVAKTLITALAGNVATLSRPMSLTTGGKPMTTLKYQPFGNPRLSNLSENPRYAETRAGWLVFAQTVTNLATSICGEDGYDVELWNELTFGSQFLDIDNYYSSNPDTVPNPTSIQLDDITYTLPEETTDWLRNPANGISAAVGISNGFEAQRPWGCGDDSPAFLTAMSKHPYSPVRRFPGDNTPDGVEPYDALKAPDYTWPPPLLAGYIPTYDTLHPEYYLSSVQTECSTRDLSPITETLYGNRHGRAIPPPGGGAPVQVWATEWNLDATGADLSDPGNEGGGPLTTPLTAADIDRICAKSQMRFLSAWVNKGLKRVYFYGATGGDLALIDDSFYTAIASAPGVYPGDSAGGVIVDSLKRLVDRFTPGTITTPRALTLEYVGSTAGNIQFEGQDTAAHPDLRNVDVFGFFPFQKTDTTFAIAVHVMTTNVCQPRVGTGPTRFDLPADTYRLKIAGLNPGATVTAYDPLNNTSVLVTTLGYQDGLLVLELPVTDSPRVLTVTG